MAQYNTSTQKIGRGTVGKPISYNTDLKTKLDDAKDIQPLLIQLVKNKVIRPNENTYYAIHFAPGVSISLGDDKSCSRFCAYHGT